MGGDLIVCWNDRRRADLLRCLALGFDLLGEGIAAAVGFEPLASRPRERCVVLHRRLGTDEASASPLRGDEPLVAQQAQRQSDRVAAGGVAFRQLGFGWDPGARFQRSSVDLVTEQCGKLVVQRSRICRIEAHVGPFSCAVVPTG